MTNGDSSRGRLIAASLLLAAIVVGLSKLPYGMFWPDEGFYLSSSYRLLLGDRPFRDELSYSSSWFFLMLTPILSLLPDGGTVLQVRFAGFIIRTGAAALLFLTFHKWLPGSLVVSGLAVSVLANYPSLMVPNYNSLPFDLGFVSLACWLAGVRSTSPNRAVAWGSAAGVLFALSCLCYLPRLPLLLVPMVLAGIAVAGTAPCSRPELGRPRGLCSARVRSGRDMVGRGRALDGLPARGPLSSTEPAVQTVNHRTPVDGDVRRAPDEVHLGSPVLCWMRPPPSADAVSAVPTDRGAFDGPADLAPPPGSIVPAQPPAGA